MVLLGHHPLRVYPSLQAPRGTLAQAVGPTLLPNSSSQVLASRSSVPNASSDRAAAMDPRGTPKTLRCTCVTRAGEGEHHTLRAVPQPAGNSSGPTRRGTHERPSTSMSGLTGAALNYLKLTANALFAGEGRNEIVNSGHSLKVCLVDFHFNFFSIFFTKTDLNLK